ncbi:MAG: YhbY family RNA-binding protein [Methanomicrobiales archaeon]|nr:YhbY family RNA-binding protein [Methanomicrobiales archaeon]
MKTPQENHELKPTVWIGKKGCTNVVCEEIRQQIKTRKVVKVRFLRSAEMNPEELAAATNTYLLSKRGRTVILEQKQG